MIKTKFTLQKKYLAVAICIGLSAVIPATAASKTEALGGELTTTGFLSLETRVNTSNSPYVTQAITRFQLESSLSYEDAGIFDELSFNIMVRPEFDMAHNHNGGKVGRGANQPSYLGIEFNAANDPIGYAGFGAGLSTGGLSKNVNQGVWQPGALSEFEVIAHNTQFPLLAPLSDRPLDCAGCRDIDDSHGDIARGNTGSSGDLYPLRELYVDALLGDFWFRLGKQQIVWGKTDFFRMQDIVNPLDYGPHFFFDSFEDIRIPQWMLSTQYRPGSIGPLDDVALQFVWNFDKFRATGLGNPSSAWAHPFGKQIGTFSAFNTYFSAEPCVSAESADAAGADFSTICEPGDGRLPSGFGIPVGLASETTPKHELENTEVGFRLEFKYEDVRFALSHYYGWSDGAVFEVKTANLDLSRVAGLDDLQNDALMIGLIDGDAGSAIEVPIAVLDPEQAIALAAAAGDADAQAAIDADNARLFYQTSKSIGGQFGIIHEQVHTTGLSFDYYEDASEIVFRVESSITFDEPVNNTRKASWVDHTDVVRWSIGLDRPTFIPFLNEDRTFFLSAQLFDTWYVDHEGDSSDGYYVGEHNLIATFFAQTHYLRDQLIPQGFVVWEEESNSWVVGASVEYLINNSFSITAGFNAISGGKKDIDFDVGPFTAFTLDGNYEQEAVFGLGRQGIGSLRDNDEAYLRIRYQF